MSIYKPKFQAELQEARLDFQEKQREFMEKMPTEWKDKMTNILINPKSVPELLKKIQPQNFSFAKYEQFMAPLEKINDVIN